MYSKGDLVIYTSYGVCKIFDLETKEIGGIKKDYYVLKPVYDESSTVYVPVNNEKLVKEMRKTLTKDEIYSVIKKVASFQGDWIEDESERKAKHKEILSSGDRCEVMKMIKCLYLHQQELYKNKKKPRISDEISFKEAERLLYQEFAYVLDLGLEQVVPFICSECEKYLSA